MIQEAFNYEAPVSPDITRRKHGGARNSERANLKINPHKSSVRQRVYDYVLSQGSNGATLHEIARALGFGNELHRVSGRISELKRDKQLVDTGDDRGGASVLRCVR